MLDGYEFNKLGFIQEGFAARYKLLRNGKRQIVNFLLPGDIVGMPGSFLDNATNSVIAVADIKLQVCSLEAFVGLCCRRPKFSLALSWLATRSPQSMASISSTSDAARRSNGRAFPARNTFAAGVVGNAEEAAFELPFTQEMMSDALG